MNSFGDAPKPPRVRWEWNLNQSKMPSHVEQIQRARNAQVLHSLTSARIEVHWHFFAHALSSGRTHETTMTQVNFQLTTVASVPADR
jgi:hypothetical protein